MANEEPTRRRLACSGYSEWLFDSILQKSARDVFNSVRPDHEASHMPGLTVGASGGLGIIPVGGSWWS